MGKKILRFFAYPAAFLLISLLLLAAGSLAPNLPAPTTGTLHVDIQPKNAVMSVDGKVLDTDTVELKPGEYKVEVSASGYYSKSGIVKIVAGEYTKPEFKLDQIKQATDPLAVLLTIILGFVGLVWVLLRSAVSPSMPR